MAKSVKLVKISDVSGFGNHLARAVRRNLAWSGQLSKSVVLSKAKEEGSVVSITVSVGEKKKDKSGMPLSGMARAYEHGSGVHGGGGKYVILPRKKKALWFYMDNPNANLPLYEKGGQIGVVLPKVMHPGVEARPYMTPALQEIRGKATEELALAIKKNLIDAMNVTIREIRQK